MHRLKHKQPAGKAGSTGQLPVYMGGTSVLRVFRVAHKNMLSAKQAGAGFKIL
jgi:hypothetical protein